MFRIVKSVLTEEGREVWRNNFRVSKIILITLIQLLNWGFFIYGAVTRPSNDKFHQHFIAASNLVLPRCLILPSLHLYCQSSSLHFILHQHEVLQWRENTSLNVLLHCGGSVVLDSRSDFDASSSNYKSSQCRSLLLQQSSEQFWWDSSAVQELQQGVQHLQLLWLSWYLALPLCWWHVLLLPPPPHSWWGSPRHGDTVNTHLLTNHQVLSPLVKLL